MVIIKNISNKPVGIIGGQVCLPNQSVVLKEKDVMCRVFDEDDHDTGEKQILPGLKVMERRGFITIDVQEEKKAEAPKAESQKEETAAEVKKPAARKRTTKKTAQ